MLLTYVDALKLLRLQLLARRFRDELPNANAQCISTQEEEEAPLPG